MLGCQLSSRSLIICLRSPIWANLPKTISMDFHVLLNPARLGGSCLEFPGKLLRFLWQENQQVISRMGTKMKQSSKPMIKDLSF